jgi:predicted flap endonuclease-1-like 5' DNA nuclease
MARWILGVFVGFILAFSSVFLLVLLLWWLWKRREQDVEPSAIEIKTEAPPPVPEPPVAEPEIAAPTPVAEPPTVEATTPEPEKTPAPDDLKRIEGIGPKISSVLQAAGISTFEQLAATAVSQIEEILEAESLRLRRLADPTTWPEQAGLAATGDWDELEALQSNLRGGRRV